jgi:hypothetical protein
MKGQTTYKVDAQINSNETIKLCFQKALAAEKQEVEAYQKCMGSVQAGMQ